MMADFLYVVEKKCVVCNHNFEATKVRSRLVTIKKDSDFCTYYKDINPYYYTVWVCPHCGYAAQDNYFEETPAAAADKIGKFLADRQVNVNFGGQRTCDQAIATYKLAIFYGELIGLPASKMGGLYLRLGWLYRGNEQENEEMVALTKAVDYYDRALSSEHLPIGNMSEITLTYLIAELFRRTGQLEKCLLYLNKVVSSQRAKLEPHILKLARESWHEARETRDQAALVQKEINE
jgi:hypothetical protein